MPVAKIIRVKNARAGVSMDLYLKRYETIKTHARAFLTLIILAIAGVFGLSHSV